MGNSLQDQLIKAGLADAKQARKPRAGKGKRKGRPEPAPSDSARAARQAMAEKADRDRELNLRRKQSEERKALAAQIRQLIAQNRIARDAAEDGYYFPDGTKIRKLFVTPTIRGQLSQGHLDIVKFDGRYEVVPAAVADKIRARNPGCVMARPSTSSTSAADDAYADYPVPDDLMW